MMNDGTPEGSDEYYQYLFDGGEFDDEDSSPFDDDYGERFEPSDEDTE